MKSCDHKPFMYAKKGYLSKLKRAIRKGFDPCTFDESYGWTVLGWAARYGNVETVKWLLENVKVRGYVNRSYHRKTGFLWRRPGPMASPLSVACEMYSWMTVTKRRRENYRWSTIENKQLEIVKLLVEHGADIHHRDVLGMTAYSRACLSGNYSTKIIAYLETLGCSEKDLYLGSVIETIQEWTKGYEIEDFEKSEWLLRKFLGKRHIPNWYRREILAQYVWTKESCIPDNEWDKLHIKKFRKFVEFLYTYNK